MRRTLFAVVAMTLALAAVAEAQCVKFDGLPAGTSWGSSAGHSSGDLVHNESGIVVSVHNFQWTSGGTFGNATVDNSWFTSSPNSVNTNNINLGFDFTALPSLPSQVAIKFRDMGGFENLSLNGSPITVGELSGGAGGGLTWTVISSPIPGGRTGKLTVNGPLHSLVIGGQEFWVDTLCVIASGERGLDHFLIYDVNDVDHEATVYLKGQFDRKGAIKTQVGALTHFANPVSKNGEEIVDKNAHLTWYKIRQEEEEPERVVTFKNQFGRQVINTGQPVLLAVPAEKREEGSAFPKYLDHFKCYKAVGEPVEKKVTLRDQFGASRNIATKPVLFCLPVHKRHEDRDFKIMNPDAHLAVYALEKQPFERRIETKDQFGRNRLEVLSRELLAVPSLKLVTEH